MATVLDRAEDRLALLQRSRSIAIVGMSSSTSRASPFVATYLLGSTDFDVYFVNPRESEVLGRPVQVEPAVPKNKIPGCGRFFWGDGEP